MPRRDLAINIESRSDDRGFKSATSSASVFERELAKLEARQRRVDDAAQRVGRGLILFGGAVAAGLALATKAAIDWETAWAGVTKTVEGSPEQLAALEEELRGLAKTLPATHEEIAGVAEAAGQLGIQRENIAEFTKVMIDLGISTNLSAQEAATALARLSNIMGVSADDVDRLGATLVDLGNKGASTEAEIADMSLAIAGAGKTIGISADQVLAWANALSSVGIEAEAGGSSISRVFMTVDQAATQGGDALNDFARVAGMSAKQFQQAYQRDASSAIAQFVAGLGRMRASGEDVFTVLQDLGLNEIRVRRALLSLANAGDLLTTSLDNGATAWRENTALLEEANKRYATSASQIKVAQNQLNDFAIDIGQTFLPLVGQAADTVGGFVQFLQGMPAPLKQAAALLAAVTAAFALTGGAAMLATVQIARFKEAQAALTITGAGLSNRLAGVAGFLTGPWGAAIAGATVLLGFLVSEHQKASQLSREFAGTLDKTTAALTEQTREMIANKLAQDGLLDTARELGISFDLVMRAATGQAGALDELNAALGLTNDQIKDAHRNEALYIDDKQQAILRSVEFSDAVGKMASSLGDAQQKTRDAAAATGDAATAQQDMRSEFQDTTSEIDDQTQALKDLDAALSALYDQLFSVEAAQDALASSIRDWTKRAKEGKLSQLELRDAGRELVDQSFEIIQKMAEQGASTAELGKASRTLKDRIYDVMRSLGASKDEARRYADALGDVPAIVETNISTPGLGAAQAGAAALGRILANIPRSITIRAQYLPGGEIAHAGGQVGVGKLPRFGSGGWFRAGSPADENLALLRDREFVQPTRAVDHYGLSFMEAVRTLRYRLPVAATSGSAVVASPSTQQRWSENRIAQAVHDAIDGATLIIDDRGRGRLIARQADLYGRGN